MGIATPSPPIHSVALVAPSRRINELRRLFDQGLSERFRGQGIEAVFDQPDHTLRRRALRRKAVRVGFALQFFPPRVNGCAVLRKLRGQAEQLEISRLEIHTRKDSPQPQRSRSFGLLNLKPSFRPSRTKSSSVPSM